MQNSTCNSPYSSSNMLPQRWEETRMPQRIRKVHEMIWVHPRYSELPAFTRFVFEQAIISGVIAPNERHNRISRDIWLCLYHGKPMYPLL